MWAFLKNFTQLWVNVNVRWKIKYDRNGSSLSSDGRKICQEFNEIEFHQQSVKAHWWFHILIFTVWLRVCVLFDSQLCEDLIQSHTLWQWRHFCPSPPTQQRLLPKVNIRSQKHKGHAGRQQIFSFRLREPKFKGMMYKYSLILSILDDDRQTAGSQATEIIK